MAAAFEKEELACTYACLMLHDAELAISAENIETVAKAAGVKVQPFWAAIFARTLEKAKLDDMLNATPAAAAPAAAVAAPAASEEKAEEKKEEKKEEEEEEEEGDFGLDLFA